LTPIALNKAVWEIINRTPADLRLRPHGHRDRLRRRLEPL